MSSPLVSVCIPVYNGARFVEETIRSVLCQTLQDFELVIVDNASTDETPQILTRLEDPRIRRFRNEENIGPIGNFNKALSLAEGKYVKLLCADDVLYPTCLADQVSPFERDAPGELSMVTCARDIIDEQGHRWMRRGHPGRGGRIAGHRAVRQVLTRGANIFGEPAAVLMRSDRLRRAGGFDPQHRYCVDLELWCRLLGLGDVHVLPQALCAFRVSRQSWSASLAHQQYDELSAFLDSLKSQLPSPIPGRWLLLGKSRAFFNSVLRQLLYRGINLKLAWRERHWP